MFLFHAFIDSFISHHPLSTFLPQRAPNNNCGLDEITCRDTAIKEDTKESMQRHFLATIARKKVTSSRRFLSTTTVKNPFRVLGLPPSSSFPTVQKTFLKLAMKHHPDTASDDYSENTENNADTFVLIRAAFEQIRNEHSRQQLRPSDYNEEDLFTEQDFLDWFFESTGVRLTSSQRKEMVHLYWKQYHRLDGKHPHGQSWDLARRLVSFQDVFLRNREKPRRTSAESEDGASAEARTNNNINLRRKRPRR